MKGNRLVIWEMFILNLLNRLREEIRLAFEQRNAAQNEIAIIRIVLVSRFVQVQ
jgi:hypothetical protein